MTANDALSVLAVLKAAYPNSYAKVTEREAKGIMAVWAVQFNDLPVEIVLMAVQKLVSTSAFPPSIAEVKKAVGSLWWDASEVLRVVGDRLTDEQRGVYERIKEASQDYKYHRGITPQLSAMIKVMGDIPRLGE